VILPGEVLPGNNCLNAWMVLHQEWTVVCFSFLD
jgi:hypothetical protein